MIGKSKNVPVLVAAAELFVSGANSNRSITTHMNIEQRLNVITKCLKSLHLKSAIHLVTSSFQMYREDILEKNIYLLYLFIKPENMNCNSGIQ